jgi:hypothetical protein
MLIKFFSIAFALMLFMLAANFGLVYAIVNFSKETHTNPSDGIMTVKGKDTLVRVGMYSTHQPIKYNTTKIHGPEMAS